MSAQKIMILVSINKKIFKKKKKIGTIKCTLSDLKCKKYEENGCKGSMFYDKMDHYISKINSF